MACLGKEMLARSLKDAHCSFGLLSEPSVPAILTLPGPRGIAVVGDDQVRLLEQQREKVGGQRPQRAPRALGVAVYSVSGRHFLLRGAGPRASSSESWPRLSWGSWVSITTKAPERLQVGAGAVGMWLAWASALPVGRRRLSFWAPSVPCHSAFGFLRLEALGSLRGVAAILSPPAVSLRVRTAQRRRGPGRASPELAPAAPPQDR